jgi:hypothetical protein
MKFLFVFIGLTFLSLNAFSQNEMNLWHFGTNGSGLKFDRLNGVTVVNGFNTRFTSCGSSTVCDPITGQLLFYTDGIRIFDASHKSMSNLLYLSGGTAVHSSGWVVHDPVVKNIFYVFSITTATEKNVKGGLYYTKVDMSKTGNGTESSPLGAVLTSEYNILLDDQVGEALQVFPVLNSHDFWIVASTNKSSKLKLYRLTSKGVQFYNLFNLSFDLTDIQAMRFSPDGTKLFVSSLVENQPCILVDFDPLLGKFSNARVIPGTPLGTSNIPWAGIIDAEWSPDGSKLYISKYREEQPNKSGGKLYQYDLNKPEVPPMLIFQVSKLSNDVSEGLRRGPDGKIYYLYNNSNNLESLVGVINKPNLAGKACKLNAKQIKFPNSYGVGTLFPHFLINSNSITEILDDSVKTTISNGSFIAKYPLPLSMDLQGDKLSYKVEQSEGADVKIIDDTLIFSAPINKNGYTVSLVYSDDYFYPLSGNFSIYFLPETIGINQKMSKGSKK